MSTYMHFDSTLLLGNRQGVRDVVTGLLHSCFFPPAAERRGRGARTLRAPAKGCALCTPALSDNATALDVVRCSRRSRLRTDITCSQHNSGMVPALSPFGTYLIFFTFF